MNKRWLILILLFWVQIQTYAQCAMCNEAARTSTSAKPEEAQALNDGIVYLLFTPYLVIAIVVGLIIYTNRKSKKEERSM